MYNSNLFLSRVANGHCFVCHLLLTKLSCCNVVTEQEIDSGILQVGSASATCICVIRKLTGLENDIQNPNCLRFTGIICIVDQSSYY